MALNKYIMTVYFTDGDSVSYDVIPVVEESKERIKQILFENRNYKTFDHWNYTFYTKDLAEHGYEIHTIDEFFARIYE